MKLNKFLFYTGLFTINGFRYNWEATVFSWLVVGIPASLYFKDAWQLIPAFIGSYLAMIHTEYINYKKVTHAQD